MSPPSVVERHHLPHRPSEATLGRAGGVFGCFRSFLKRVFPSRFRAPLHSIQVTHSALYSTGSGGVQLQACLGDA